MVQTAYLFNCDICGQSYASQALAINCESKGQPTIVFPRGLIFQSPTLSLDMDKVYAVKSDAIIGHQHNLECWEIDKSNISDSMAMESRVKSIDFNKILMTPPQDQFQSVATLLVAINNFLISVKALPPIKLIDTKWWIDSDTPIG